MKATGRPKYSTGQANVLSEKQQKALFGYLNGLENPLFRERNKAMMMLIFKLGLRAKELAALDIDDIVDSRGAIRDILRLTSNKTKGGRHRDLPLSNKALRATLASYLSVLPRSTYGKALFLTQKRNRFSPNSMQQTIKRLFEDAGLEGKYSSHTGRRTFITSLARKGFDVNSIRDLAGHASLSTTQRYVQNDPSRLENMLNSL